MTTTNDLRLLIIEDDESVARMEQRCLSRHWKSITIVPDAQSGIDEISSGNHDVVLTDWDCPNGGGERIIRDSTIPVVVYTGSSEAQLNPNLNVLGKPSDTKTICDSLLTEYLSSI